MIKKLIYIVLLIGLVSCKTQKNIVKTPQKPVVESAAEIAKKNLFSKIEKATLNFETLKIKATADIETDTSYPSVSTTLYFDKGKQIWANASMILNIARASIKPEGFKMYEKINKTYIDSDFNFVNNLLKVDFINFNSVEDLLLGRIFFPIKNSDFDFSSQGNAYVLQSKKAVKIGEGHNSGLFSQQITFDFNFNLKQVVLEEVNRKSKLQIDYGDYAAVGNTNLPKSIKIFIKDTKESKISLEYNKFELSKMDTPFEIPSGYKKRIIK